jgi:asparagine synthase (glutamine-hydrolysing)
MCGICGKIDPRGVSQDEIQMMTDTLSHRGPDDQGVYVNGVAGLGHRRLSIIDLCHGSQPLSNEDGSLWIVFNGEIYNYQELRSRLQDSHRFSTRSDTEVILHLYEEKRERCVEDLRGMFAFAIWDSREQSLFLARDHLGQKPLFFSHEGEKLTFASEIKALLAINASLRQMDVKALHQYLTLRIVAPPRTMYSSVRKLPPAHFLIFQKGHLHVERYWHLRYRPKLRLGEEELLEELEHRVLEAVRCHMVSDVPVGAFLSGGLDSSLIVAMMSKVSGQPFKTFSLDVPYQEYSELPFARRIAEQYHTQHYEDTIYPSLIKVLPDLLWHLDEPSDPLSACMYYLAEMASREVKVALGGDGGDELFGGYDRYYGNRYVHYYAHTPEAFRRDVIGRLLRQLPDGFWYKSLSHKLKWLNHLSFAEGGRRYARSLGYFYFTEEFRETLFGEKLNTELNGFDPEEAICSYFDCADADNALDKMLFTDSMIRLPDHSVMILDRTTMAHGLEARSPFLDHKLAEFMAKVPISFKVRGRTRRYIQRKLAERYLPARVVQRKKQGLSSALPYLLTEEFPLLFKTFLCDSHLVRDGYLKEQPIARLLGEHLEKRVDHGNRLWLLCNSEIWYRMAIEGWAKEELRERLSETNITFLPRRTVEDSWRSVPGS